MTYGAAPAKLKQPGVAADTSITPKSMSIIVAPDPNAAQAAFPVPPLTAHSRDDAWLRYRKEHVNWPVGDEAPGVG